MVQLAEKRATFFQLLKNWFISYFGNMAGAILTIKLLALTGLATIGHPAVKVANAKTSLTFLQVIGQSPSTLNENTASTSDIVAVISVVAEKEDGGIQ